MPSCYNRHDNIFFSLSLSLFFFFFFFQFYFFFSLSNSLPFSSCLFLKDILSTINSFNQETFHNASELSAAGLHGQFEGIVFVKAAFYTKLYFIIRSLFLGKTMLRVELLSGIFFRVKTIF